MMAGKPLITIDSKRLVWNRVHTADWHTSPTLRVHKADSLAFFNVLDIYVNWRKPEKVEHKIKYMFGRIDDPKIQGYLRELEFNDQRAIDIFRKIVG